MSLRGLREKSIGRAGPREVKIKLPGCDYIPAAFHKNQFTWVERVFAQAACCLLPAQGMDLA
jgi:hypothetical protein